MRFDTLSTPLRGKCLIEASAGTGKTFAIASLYLRLVIELGLAPENILVVTFTDAATKELRDRIRKRLRQARSFFVNDLYGDELLSGIGERVTPELAAARIDAALQQFDSAAIATIHSFCAAVLNENRFETGSLFDTELMAGGNALLATVIDDYWRSAFFANDAQLLVPVMKHKLTPERLVKLLDRKIQNPFTRILPDDESFAGVELDSIAASLYAAICSCWQSDRQHIMELLANDKSLTRNADSYRPDLLPAIFDGMDAYVNQGNPYAAFPKFHKLTQEMVARETKKNFEPLQEPLFGLCSALETVVRRRVTTFITEAADYARRELPLIKSRLNLRSYDDLLTDLLAALEGEHGERLVALLNQRYQAALIDEFQDTDQVQFRIFDLIFVKTCQPLFLIGDPKQAIYSFRGADLFAYIDARQGVPDDSRYTMDTNWRSTGPMVQAVNQLFLQQGQLPFVNAALGFQPVQAADSGGDFNLVGYDPAALQLWFFNREQDDKPINKGDGVKRVAKAVAAEIAALLAAAATGRAFIDGRPLAPDDIAVIVRSHSQAEVVRQELSFRSIPAVVQSGKSIFTSDEASELALVISAIATPPRESLLKGALITSIFGYRADTMYQLITDEAAWEELVAVFNGYRELWQLRGFMVMFRTMLKNEAVQARLLALPAGERRLTNLLQAAEILNSRESSGHSGLQSLVTWFCEQVAGQPEAEEYQLRLESDDSAVKVVTVHLSKGLEYPVVFVPFAWGGVMADDGLALCHRDGQLVADFGSDDFTANSARALEEGLSEVLRLLYVAVTRAKYRCYLAWGRFKDCELSAPAYLFHNRGEPSADVLSGLREAMAKISDVEMVSDLQSFAVNAHGCVNLSIDPVSLPSAAPAPVESRELPECRSFTGEISRSWRVASFSSLVSGHRESPELPDRDSQDALLSEQVQKSTDETIFSFPKGTQAGTLLHGILEELDFMRVDDGYYREIVMGHLEKAGLNEKWLSPVAAMLRNVMTARLGLDGLRLCDIAPDARRSELEFLFPLNLVEAAGLKRLLARESGARPSLAKLAAMLNFREQEGMLLGFVDLVFTYRGKFYIIDWKSNHLGDSAADYSQQRIQGEMTRHLYPLQYLLYSVALHRYLKLRLPSYSYAEHFGGVYYLFIRGMDPAFPDNGVYFDRPEESLVASLEQYFAASGEGGAHV